MSVKIASALPKSEEHNGLTAVRDILLSEPTSLHVCVIVADCSKITTDVDTGDAIPTARIRLIEVVDDPEAKQRLQQYARRAREQRTGKTVLPLDLEDELNEAFGSSGEV